MAYRREGGIIYSDDGWKLQTLGTLSRLKYVDENGREAIVSCEIPYLGGIALYPGQMHHWLIPARQPLTDDERSQIIERVSDAIKWSGIGVHIRENGITIVSIGGKPNTGSLH